MGFGLKLMEVTCLFFFFFKLTASEVLVFDWLTYCKKINQEFLF